MYVSYSAASLLKPKVMFESISTCKAKSFASLPQVSPDLSLSLQAISCVQAGMPSDFCMCEELTRRVWPCGCFPSAGDPQAHRHFHPGQTIHILLSSLNITWPISHLRIKCMVKDLQSKSVSSHSATMLQGFGPWSGHTSCNVFSYRFNQWK